LTATGAVTATNGSSYTLNLSASDPGDDTISGWTINWGDGTIETVVGDPSSVTHTYTNAGFSNNILVSATDEDGTYTPSDLLLTSGITDSLFRFEATDGSFTQEFANGSGINSPVDIEIGLDGLIYATGFASDDIRRYDATTGAFIDTFVAAGSGGLNSPSRLAWGGDGHLYVTSMNTSEVLRFNGTTGAFIDAFVSSGSGGLNQPDGIAFGGDGNLYVASDVTGEILRYDGTTGTFIDQFVNVGSTGFTDITFGPDGHLYVSNVPANKVQRFDGSTGAYIDDFVTAGSGGINGTAGLNFGPDGHLYVVGWNSDDVFRYNGSTGVFIDVFVPSGTGQDAPVNLAFTPAHQVTITSNAPPTVDLDANDSSGATGNDYQLTFTEGAAPTAIADSDTDLVDGDSTTFDHVKLSITGLLDGNAETLLLDGDTFALATAVAGQDTTGSNYHVVIGTGAGTATVTLTKQGGGLFTEGETETLITAIQYQHTDASAPTDGDRLIDVIVNDGTSDSSAARTTINVNPVNQ
jgi:streptogramin lyase